MLCTCPLLREWVETLLRLTPYLSTPFFLNIPGHSAVDLKSLRERVTNRFAASVLQPRHNQAWLGPTEPRTEGSRFLLSSGRE